jgi:hypothetical protein
VEAEGGASRGFELLPVAAGGLEQPIDPDDVDLDDRARPVIERSTWLSAARLRIASTSCSSMTASIRRPSEMSASTKA